MNASPDSAEQELDLSHYLDVVLRRRWIVLASLLVVSVSTALYTFTVRPVYQASTLMIIEKERGGPTGYGTGTLVENSNDDYYQTQYKLLQSVTLAQRVYDELQLDKHEDFQNPRGLEKLQEAVQISPVLRSRLVYIRTSSHDPALAAKISDHMSDVFVKQNLANQMFISKEVLEALQVREGRRQSYDSLPAVVNNPLIQTLKGEYAKLDSQYADLSQKFTPKYPAMISLKSNMAALKGQIEAETDKIVQSLKTELSGQLKGNNVRIIDPARIPEKPIRPRKVANLVLGLIAGLTLGLALSFLIETLDQTVRTQDDVEQKLSQPFLGAIPHSAVIPGKVYSPLTANELSLTSEAFRNLRTMVDFAGVGGRAKAVLVTSSVQGEGKTYVAANLAVALAQLGESVLLIDGDLRRPNLHRSFDLSSERGLSDYLLAGRRAEEVLSHIQKCEVPGLSILPCGNRPPNPSELLNTPRVAALVAWATQQYDRVVVDCTPMFPINDTLLWGRHIPSSVFVVRFGETRIPLIRTAGQKLQAGGIKVFGVAVNAAKATGLSYASYGHYYQQYYHGYNHDAPKDSAEPAKHIA